MLFPPISALAMGSDVLSTSCQFTAKYQMNSNRYHFLLHLVGLVLLCMHLQIFQVLPEIVVDLG